MMLIPLTDASRRPTRVPVVTAGIIALNALMFVLELAGDDVRGNNRPVLYKGLAASQLEHKHQRVERNDACGHYWNTRGAPGSIGERDQHHVVVCGA